MKAVDIVAVAPGLVELDHVCQQQSSPHGAKRSLDEGIRGGVGIGVNAGDAPAGEKIVNLAHAHPGNLPLGQSVQESRAWWGQAEIPAVPSAPPGTGSPTNGRAMIRETACSP